MGDIIEFVTSPSLGHRSFKITSNGINFDVKTPEFASLILSKKSGSKGDNIREANIITRITETGNNIDFIKNNLNSFKLLPATNTNIIKRKDLYVKIENDVSWIGKNFRDQRVLTKTPDIIAGNFYSRLWLAWNEKFVTFGKEGQTIPILKYPYDSSKCMYVTFLKEKGHHTVHWRVELPPSLKQLSINNINKGDVRWVPADTELPGDALIGGFEKENLYIIRATHRGSLTPGKFVPSEGCGYLAWGGEAHGKIEYEVLCGYNCEWVPTREDRIPVGAVEGGYSEVRREVLYVARALHCGYIIPGKVAPSHRVCYIPFNGKEIAKEKYEILVAPTKEPYANKFILPNETLHMHDTEQGDAFGDYDL